MKAIKLCSLCDMCSYISATLKENDMTQNWLCKYPQVLIELMGGIQKTA